MNKEKLVKEFFEKEISESIKLKIKNGEIHNPEIEQDFEKSFTHIPIKNLIEIITSNEEISKEFEEFYRKRYNTKR